LVDLPDGAQSSAEAAIDVLVDQLVQSGRVKAEDAARVCCQVLHRESLGSTNLLSGVALPHSKSDAVTQVTGIVGKATDPIPWPGAPGGKPVHLVCLLITPVSERGKSLMAMETLSRRIRGD
jgi:mannitol/fructose-specific phosphotransferase system IIA component (Ntr-type)